MCRDFFETFIRDCFFALRVLYCECCKRKGSDVVSVLDYLFPPICFGCGARQLPSANGVLCASCLARWEEETTKSCSRCGRRMPHCVCQPSDGMIARRYPVFALGAYRHGTVIESLVLTGKRLQSKALFDFLAQALAKRLVVA